MVQTINFFQMLDDGLVLLIKRFYIYKDNIKGVPYLYG